MTGVQTCALPIYPDDIKAAGVSAREQAAAKFSAAPLRQAMREPMPAAGQPMTGMQQVLARRQAAGTAPPPAAPAPSSNNTPAPSTSGVPTPPRRPDTGPAARKPDSEELSRGNPLSTSGTPTADFESGGKTKGKKKVTESSINNFLNTLSEEQIESLQTMNEEELNEFLGLLARGAMTAAKNLGRNFTKGLSGSTTNVTRSSAGKFASPGGASKAGELAGKGAKVVKDNPFTAGTVAGAVGGAAIDKAIDKATETNKITPTAKADSANKNTTAPDDKTPTTSSGKFQGTIKDFQKANPGATVGQAMNAIQGKTAIAGGKNDPSVIAAQRRGMGDTQGPPQVYDPGKLVQKGGSASKSSETPKQETPKPDDKNTSPGILGKVKDFFTKPTGSEVVPGEGIKTPDKPDEKESGGKRKKVSESTLINAFLKLQETKAGNIFEAAKKIGRAHV